MTTTAAAPRVAVAGEAGGVERLPLFDRSHPPCSSCTLHRASGPVVHTSNPHAEVLILGEAPGEQEVLRGEPFVGPAGFELEKLLQRAGLERAQFAIANVLMCRPSGNNMDVSGNAVAQCSTHLDRFVVAHPRLRCVLAMGNTAMHAAAGTTGGKEEGILRWRGWWQDSRWGIPMLATFHPSYLLPRRGQPSSTKWVGVATMDIQKALRGPRPAPAVRTPYLLDPPLEVAWTTAHRALQARPLLLAYDLETIIKRASKGDPDTLPDGSGILRISFAWGEHLAMSIPWHSTYFPVIQMLLQSDVPKATWNGWNFDNRVLETTPFAPRGTLHDFMVAWHVLWPNLPKGLEFAASFWCDHLSPWKHLSHLDFPRYSAIDSDATIVTALQVMTQLKGVLPLAP